VPDVDGMLRISKRSARALTLVAAGLASVALARDVVRRVRRLDMRGRVVLITGGTRGLGLLLAEEVGRLGARVAICGRDPAAVTRARQRLNTLGVEVHALSCDLGAREEAEAFVDSVVDAFGGIDVVINNAGAIQVAPMQDLGLEAIEESMRANFWSAVYVTLRALPYLREEGSGGRVVNITSLGGRVGLPHLTPYTAAKFAFVGFSEAMHAELASAGVKVTTVVPGLMRTGSIYNAEFAGQATREFAWFAAATSMPLLSISARRAARHIVRAMRDGRAEARLGATAHAVSFVHGIAPGLTARIMALTARLLPKPAGQHEPTRGRDLRSPLQGTVITRLSDRAARQNNEAPPPQAR